MLAKRSSRQTADDQEENADDDKVGSDKKILKIELHLWSSCSNLEFRLLKIIVLSLSNLMRPYAP